MIAKFLHLKPLRMATGVSALLLGLFALSGCGDSYPPDLTYGVRTDPIVTARPQKDPPSIGAPGQWFYLDPAFANPKEYAAKVVDPKGLTAEQRRVFDKSLTELFGTPAAPKVAKVEGLEAETLQILRLDSETLAAGSKLYRQHCLHCHGLTGDGHGPTAAWVNPHPRDFRPGKFKFTSSSQASGERKPRREDLLRVLRYGVEGTAMPAFGQLDEADRRLNQLASYVIHLSLRGQCELDGMDFFFKTIEAEPAKKSTTAGIEERIKELLVELAGSWRDAESSLIAPTPSLAPKVVLGNFRGEEERKELQASITRGFNQFMSAGEASCIGCHVNFGRTPNLKWDDWGTVVRPANLTTGVYRGGRRPLDIYWRVYSGINGTGMPALYDKNLPEEKRVQREKDIWDLVNFVQALPYPAMLPEDIRDKVYPSSVATKETAGLISGGSGSH